ncbi:MAG: hypothetical protein SFW36_00625 [Leptolyngbyaceae cyanobacterium bins.59]|nr:hypothetical protein [Leptolyngbyaceae cyanobacterium bins.59]
MFSQCCASGQLSRRDRDALQAILLNSSPTEEDLTAIDRILHGIVGDG